MAVFSSLIKKNLSRRLNKLLFLSYLFLILLHKIIIRFKFGYYMLFLYLGRKKMNKIVILLVVLMMVGIGFLSGCSDRSSEESSGGNTVTPKSDTQITSKTSRTGYSGIDFCAFIDIVVHNYGDAGGSADVWAELKQDTNTAEKRQSIYLNSGESKSLTLTFCELSYWSGSGFTYRVWIE